MFVLATHRTEFGHVWEQILKKRGKVRQVRSIEDLRQFLHAHTARLVMLDLELPDSRNSATLRVLAKECGSGKLMLGGVQFTPNAELAGLAVGAVACCGPDLPVEECERMVEVILGGGVWLSNAGIPALVDRLRNLSDGQAGLAPAIQFASPPPETAAEETLSKLTRREREVAELVGSGANNKIIARKLLITDRTVKAHLTAIYDKLNISDRLQLALRLSAHKTAKETVNE